METTTRPSPACHAGAAAAQGTIDLAAALQLHLVATLRRLDLTEALAGALCAFGSDGGCLPRRDLAARLRCDPSNVTFLADRLEAKGYIERTVDGRDRRVKAIRLTPEGEDVRTQLLEGLATGSPFERLSPDELDQFVALLGRLTGSSAAELSARALGDPFGPTADAADGRLG